jgi:secreted PhoX family phosphatase
MDDGFYVLHRADGMVAFPDADPDMTILVRNHEIRVGSSADASAFKAEPELPDRISDMQTYDRMSNGQPCP